MYNVISKIWSSFRSRATAKGPRSREKIKMSQIGQHSPFLKQKRSLLIQSIIFSYRFLLFAEGGKNCA
jgi:hypothetical protein